MVLLQTALALWLGLLLASGLHELGHAVVARGAGARRIQLRVGYGPGLFHLCLAGGRLQLGLLFPVGGCCSFEGDLPWRAALAERAAGSLVNLGIAALLALAWPMIAGVVAWSVLVAQLAVGLGQLVPLGELDGAQLKRLLHSPQRTSP
ncbi:MAG: site-2 protease family protein [Pseudomonadota bacterium]